MGVKKGFTIEDHHEAASLLKQASENLFRLSVKFAETYGKTKEPYLSIRKAEKALLIVKNNTDDLFYKEIPSPQNSPYYVK